MAGDLPDLDAFDATGEPEWTGTRWDPYLRDATLDGRRLRYLDVGEGPTVLLVHGLGASWQAWYRNIADLAADHRVLAVDLPGFGRSQALSRAAGIRGYTAVLAALLDQLEITDALVVGHSLGGLIVQRLAARYPDRVAGIVLVCSGDGVLGLGDRIRFEGLALIGSVLRYWRPPALLEPALRGLLALAPVRRALLSRVVHDPALVPPELAAVMVSSVLRSPALADAVRAGLRGDVDPGAVRCPALVVAGRHDRLVPELTSRRLAAAIPGARHEVWPDVGHHPMLERAPDFSARIRAFAREIRRAA